MTILISHSTMTNTCYISVTFTYIIFYHVKKKCFILSYLMLSSCYHRPSTFSLINYHSLTCSCWFGFFRNALWGAYFHWVQDTIGWSYASFGNNQGQRRHLVPYCVGSSYWTCHLKTGYDFDALGHCVQC